MEKIVLSLWKYLRKLKNKEISIIKKFILFPLYLTNDLLINSGMKKSKIIVNQTEDQKASTKQLLGVEGQVIPNYFPSINKKYNEKSDTIIWISNLAPNKNPELYINIIKNLNLKDWDFVIAGGTSNKSYEEKIKKLSNELNIKFLGKIDFFESTDLIGNSKILINTSDNNSDGLPNTFIQSWLAGTIVC